MTALCAQCDAVMHRVDTSAIASDLAWLDEQIVEAEREALMRPTSHPLQRPSPYERPYERAQQHHAAHDRMIRLRSIRAHMEAALR